MSELSRRYLRGWFVLDLVSAVPGDLIVLSTGGQIDLKAMRIVRLMRLTKMTRVARIQRMIDSWQDTFKISNASLAMTKIIAIILFCTHWMVAFQSSVSFLLLLRLLLFHMRISDNRFLFFTFLRRLNPLS